MTTIQLQVDDQLLDRVQAIAAARHCTVQELLVEMLKLLTKPEVVNDSITGMFADEPEAMDQIIEAIARDRGWQSAPEPRE